MYLLNTVVFSAGVMEKQRERERERPWRGFVEKLKNTNLEKNVKLMTKFMANAGFHHVEKLSRPQKIPDESKIFDIF